MDEKFFNQANAILNSKFARNIYVQYIKKGSSNTRTILTIDPISIDSFIGDLQSSVAYNPFILLLLMLVKWQKAHCSRIC